MLLPNEQSLKNLDPSSNMDDAEFNDLTLKFGSFISMSQNKCLNYVATIAIIMKNPEYKKAYMSLIGSDNLYGLIQKFIQNTPNLYKKIAKKSLFQ